MDALEKRPVTSRIQAHAFIRNGSAQRSLKCKENNRVKVCGLIANRNLWVSHLWHGHYPIDLSDCGGWRYKQQRGFKLKWSEWIEAVGSRVRHRNSAIRRSCSFI